MTTPSDERCREPAPTARVCVACAIAGIGQVDSDGFRRLQEAFGPIPTATVTVNLVLLAISTMAGIWLALRFWKSNAIDLKRLLFILLLLFGFALIDASVDFFLLDRALSGRAWPRALVIALLLSVLILGLGAISLYVFRYYCREPLGSFVLIYVSLGFSAGLALFSARQALNTLYLLLRRKLVLFSDDTLGQILGLSGFCIVICTSVGLIRRAVSLRRGRPEVKPDRPRLPGGPC